MAFQNLTTSELSLARNLNTYHIKMLIFRCSRKVPVDRRHTEPVHSAEEMPARRTFVSPPRKQRVRDECDWRQDPKLTLRSRWLRCAGLFVTDFNRKTKIIR